MTLTPEGQRLACDVMVTAAPTPWQEHGSHLHISAAAKATRYNCAAGGFAHDRAQFFPTIHDAHNHWISGHALRLLHRITSAQARHTVPLAQQTWGPHFQHAIADASSELMCETVVSAWRMHAACGRML